MTRLNTNGIYWLGAHLREAFLLIGHPLGAWVRTARQCQIYLQTALRPDSRFRLKLSKTHAQEIDLVLGMLIDQHKQDGDDRLATEEEITLFNNAYFTFNSALELELSQAPIFFVTPKGVYDTDSLINNGSSVYEDFIGEVPKEAIDDTNQAARCLAFTLPTASGFHIARATEAVTKKYLLYLGCKEEELKKASNWGGYVKLMKENGGKGTIGHHLDQLRILHRNPLIHPEITMDMTEAQSLWAMCTSLITSIVNEMRPAPSGQSRTPSDPVDTQVPSVV